MEIYLDSYEAFVDFERASFPWEQFSKTKIDDQNIRNKFWARTLGLPNILSRMEFIDTACEKFDKITVDSSYLT